MLDLRAWREWRNWIPAECPGCDRRVPGQGLCPECLVDLLRTRIGGARCTVCAHPLEAGRCPDCLGRAPAFDRVVAAFDYHGLGERLVKDFKLTGRLALAGVLADRLAGVVRDDVLSGPSVDWVVPVPARRDSLRQRGFSPPAEIARILSQRLRLPYRLDLLYRTHEGPKQSTLKRAERLQAPQGAYACERIRGLTMDLSGRHVVVVDDVLTTGSTLQAVASVLKAAGAARVSGWVLARTARASPAAGSTMGRPDLPGGA
ncbi:MAG: ComF family protein [Castellaniella sp.]|uniref:ComF family protein n=1 Tax=Castellaniella sp. TaxID=1955812 RepID=UPI00120988BA|nr:ComF family protein [Castellaniella sp.]TAN28237.1 MAG: ComF family protein [Castellaniella sp.]